MKLITRLAAPPFTVGGTTVTGYAAPSRGASEVSLWRIQLSPGSSSPLHRMDVEQVFLVVDGEAVAVDDESRLTIKEGDCLNVPARTPFPLTAGETRPFLAVACMTSRGQATMLPDGASFVPPWAE